MIRSKIVKGNYDITGEVHFSLMMKKNDVLTLHVNKATNLAAAAGREHLSNP